MYLKSSVMLHLPTKPIDVYKLRRGWGVAVQSRPLQSLLGHESRAQFCDWGLWRYVPGPTLTCGHALEPLSTLQDPQLLPLCTPSIRRETDRIALSGVLPRPAHPTFSSLQARLGGPGHGWSVLPARAGLVERASTFPRFSLPGPGQAICSARRFEHEPGLANPLHHPLPPSLRSADYRHSRPPSRMEETPRDGLRLARCFGL